MVTSLYEKELETKLNGMIEELEAEKRNSELKYAEMASECNSMKVRRY